jgi:hypothetical protein
LEGFFNLSGRAHNGELHFHTADWMVRLRCAFKAEVGRRGVLTLQ